MANNYVSQKDISKMLETEFKIGRVEWIILHPNYEYCGLATCNAELPCGIRLVAFPCLIGYSEEVPIYRAHIIYDALPSNLTIDDSQTATYKEKGILLENKNGVPFLKKTIATKTHNPDSANTIDLNDLKEAIYEIQQAKKEFEGL